MQAWLDPLSTAPPSPWRAYAAMLLRSRHGLGRDGVMPRIARNLGPVKLNANWLAGYRGLIGLPAEEPGVLPPLALQIAAAPLHLDILADAQFPFRAMGLVHVAQRIDQTCHIMPGAVLRLDAFTGQATPARKGSNFELVTEARREGRLVWRSITLVQAREPYLGDPPSTASASLISELTVDPPVWLRRGVFDAPEDLGRRYAAIAGDWNPIHQRACLARPFGFDRAIVHGTWTLARAMVATGWPQHEAYSLHARFRKPVKLPSQGLTVFANNRPTLQSLRVTDEDGDKEHMTAHIEPALAWSS